MPETLTEIPASTPFTDRELLRHALAHIEDMHDRMEQIWTVLQPFVPMLASMAPAGQADILTIMQARRELRRGARGQART